MKNHIQKGRITFIILGLVLSALKLQAGLPLPSIPSTPFTIVQYGASTSNTDNAIFINAAITAANKAGGGTVIIPTGTFFSGPITMQSNVNLCISAGAILQILPYGKGNGTPAGSYPNNGKTDQYTPFIYGSGLSNIEVSGSGTIEGNGSDWWTAYEKLSASNQSMKRPCLIRLASCNTVLITGITLKNAPVAHITLGAGNPIGSNGTISNVTVISPSTSPNTDAIDIWYWDGIAITNCNLSGGDDDIAFDSHSSNAKVMHCTFGTGHGLSVGSYTTGVNHIFADSCTFNGTKDGIRLKSALGRGDQDSVFSYSNITMTDVANPFYISGCYPSNPTIPSKIPSNTLSSTTPAWSNIHFKNITVTNSPNAGIIAGLPEMAVNNIVFDNVHITTTKTGMVVNYVKGLVFNCSSITTPNGDAIIPYGSTISGINTTTGISTSCSVAPSAVIITSPNTNTSVCVGTSITLTATANSTNNVILKVTFYDGTTLLGTSTTLPYSYAWTNASTGSHAIQAKATDNIGITTLSAAINITVNALPIPTITGSHSLIIGSSTILTTNTESLYKWSNGTVILGSTQTYTVTASGVYSLSVTDTNGCEGSTTFQISQLTQQTINLIKGWNLISTNVYLNDSSISNIFNGLDVQEIKSMNSFWRKGQNSAFNFLNTITAGQGYLVLMNAAGTIKITETPIIVPKSQFVIKSGWQLIGCPYQNPTSLASTFNANNTKAIKNFNGFWIPNNSTSSIQNLEPSKGYFIQGK
jgi:polygalacturonase